MAEAVVIKVRSPNFPTISWDIKLSPDHTSVAWMHGSIWSNYVPFMSESRIGPEWWKAIKDTFATHGYHWSPSQARFIDSKPTKGKRVAKSAVEKIQEYVAFGELPEELQEIIRSYTPQNTKGYINTGGMSVYFYFDRSQRKVTRIHLGSGDEEFEYEYDSLTFDDGNPASEDASEGVYCDDYHCSMTDIFRGKQDVVLTIGDKSQPNWVVDILT